MKRSVLVLSTLLLAACGAPIRNVDRLQAGMTPAQVRPIMGEPDTVAHAPGKQCAYYSLTKDFWRRTPWSISERYFVCYDDGKLDSFGKVDGEATG